MGTGACFGTIPTEQHNTERRKETRVLDFYSIVGVLGSGATSRVLQASPKNANHLDIKAQVALKIMDKKRTITEQLYHREVTVLHRLHTTNPSDKCKHIVPLDCYGEDDEYCYIATPFMPGGELFDRIVTRDDAYKITETVAARLTLNMLEAIQYCHDRMVVHRDIKPENFVFVDKTIDSGLVLIDFGGALVVRDDDVITDVAGTPYYLAPELAIAALNNYRNNGKDVSSKIGDCKPRTGTILKASDTYAIGIITFVMMTGRAPFRGRNATEIYEATCLKPFKFPKTHVTHHNALNLSDHFKDFIRKILCKDPVQRMSAEEAMQHPWIQSVHVKEKKDIVHGICISPIPRPEHVDIRRFR